MVKNIQGLLDNEVFIEKLVNAETPQGLAHVLDENHIALDGATPEEAFAEIQKRIADAQAGKELNEDELESVTGGAMGWGSAAAAVAGSAGAATWASICLPVIGICVAIGLAKWGYNKLKKARTK